MLSQVSDSRPMWKVDEVISVRLWTAGQGLDVTRLLQAGFDLPSE